MQQDLEQWIKEAAEKAPDDVPTEEPDKDDWLNEQSEEDKRMEEERERRGYYLACAMHPRDRGRSHGKLHIVLNDKLESGRLKRKRGDALCKPSSKFWGLSGSRGFDLSDRSVCKRCREMYDRYSELIGEQS